MRVGFAGFGNVGTALARLILERRAELRRRQGLEIDVTLLASARRGALVEPAGLDLARALEAGWSAPLDAAGAIAAAPLDLLLLATPLDPRTGEPGLSLARAALARGVSVVTADKGPVALARRELRDLARSTGAGFRFESAVADCLPVFNLVETTLPIGRIDSFRGILNSTSNHVLAEIARGRGAAAAVAEMQRQGIAEADPAYDLDGWDQAVKAAILSDVLLDRVLRPEEVGRTPLDAVDAAWLRSETAAGRTVRLVAEGAREGPVRVAAVSLPPGEFLATLPGHSLGLVLHGEPAGTVGVFIVNPGVTQTAYGMLADLLAIHAGRRILPELS